MNPSAIIAWLRQHGRQVALEVGINFVAPVLIYDAAHGRYGDVNALLMSSGPPIAWSLIELIRKRRIDAVSMLAVAGIALSLLAFVGGGGARFLQLRERMVTVIIGVAFLFSAAIGKPLIYQLARARMRRGSPEQAAELEALKDDRHFRRSMTVMTVVWGTVLVLEATVSATMVFTMSIHDYLIASRILGYGVLGALILWTFLYVRHRRSRGAARRAREAAEAAAAQAEAEGA
jgi:cyanate permease